MASTYFYMRISTKENTDKQSFQRQSKALEKYAIDNNLNYDNRTVYKDDISGKTFDRKDWKALEKILQSGDTIIFKEISRFTRQAEEGYIKYMELLNKGINLVFLDNPTVSSDYIKQLTSIANSQQLVTKTALEGTIKLLLIVELDRVQQERELIVKRIKQGIEASDKPSGRKSGQLDKMSDELRADILDFLQPLLQDKKIKQVDLMKKHSISRNTLKKYIDIVKNEQQETTTKKYKDPYGKDLNKLSIEELKQRISLKESIIKSQNVKESSGIYKEYKVLVNRLNELEG